MLSVFFNTLLMCVLLSQCELIPTMGSHVLLKGTMVRTSNVLCIATHTVPRTYPYLVGVDLGILSMRRSWSAGGLHTTLDTIILCINTYFVLSNPGSVADLQNFSLIAVPLRLSTGVAKKKFRRFQGEIHRMRVATKNRFGVFP
jgi:hypothetical protein